MTRKNAQRLIALIPFVAALWVWLSPLAFVPVPWPDDSAFYFVGKELFRWPPRWVMLPQAPFEPTYRIFNFNTMPLYPFLVGLGRLIGIDGSFGIKFWPLLGWAASGSLLGVSLMRAKLPAWLALLFTLGFALDPTLRWASVLVRPESLIGLCGMALVLGLTLGFPRSTRAQGLWDPIAALLAIGAYSHFNAVHLLFPVVVALGTRPKRLISVGLRTALYLSPWALTVLWHPALFVHQMTTQWKRLAVSNDWLDTPSKAIASLFQGMGSPEPWPPVVQIASVVLWFFILTALGFGLIYPVMTWALRRFQRLPGQKGISAHHTLNLAPAAAWVLGSIWLWNSKPEVWFTYYIHASVWAFAALCALKAWQALRSPEKKSATAGMIALGTSSILGAFLVGIFGYVDVSQARSLGQGVSWRWSTYYDLIDCVDAQLTQLEKRLGNPKPFRVWDPTFPDITIELSRRHPDWELTRTNDFWERADLALQHGREVEAVVVPETINSFERTVSAPASEHPEIRSIWMNWNGYFLHHLQEEPGWKPERYICQRGRWQAFLYMKSKQ